MAVGLILCAALSVWLSPRILTRGRWQVHHPRLALSLWHSAFGLGLMAAAASVIVAVASTLEDSASSVPRALLATLGGWVALGIVGGVALMVAAGSGDVGDASRRNRSALLALPHVAQALDRKTELRVCASPDPFACSVPSTRGTVVVTTGLIELLTPAQLRAVVAHERAHLAGHHHLALRLADLDLACVPRSAAAQRFRSATGFLVELIADDRAARTAGAVHLANALVRIGACSGDEMMQLRAERLARRRWRRTSRLAPLPAAYPVLVHAVSARR